MAQRIEYLQYGFKVNALEVILTDKNHLTTLYVAPDEIGRFSAKNNKIQSLDYALITEF